MLANRKTGSEKIPDLHEQFLILRRRRRRIGRCFRLAAGGVDQLDHDKDSCGDNQELDRRIDELAIAEHNVLGWLMQGYRDKAEVFAQLALFANDGDRGTKLFGRQRL